MTISNKTKTRKRHNHLAGGEVIASGGFGCVFRPGLTCTSVVKSKNRKGTRKLQNEPHTQIITKLMRSKYAKKEYAEIVKYRPILKKIPDYTDYFLIEGFTLCKPGPLGEEDLKNFDTQCKPLEKLDITSENINESLDKLLAINMPYGGIELGDYILENQTNPVELIQLNNTLIRLLVKGIVPMNNLGVFHCDLKGANILVIKNKNQLYARLIDWGLSTTYHKGGAIPKVLLSRPFQYNVPFSNVLFTDEFKQMYSSFLKENPGMQYHTVRTFVINYVLTWIDKRGVGHLKTINSIFKELYENDFVSIDSSYKTNLIEFDYTFYHIFEYITHILLKFTHAGHFDERKYLYEVYSKNVDVWGFVTSYIPILELLNKNHEQLNTDHKKIIKLIRDMIIIVIEYSDSPVNIHRIVEKLHELNHFLPSMKDFKQYDGLTEKKELIFSANSGDVDPIIKKKEKAAREDKIKSHLHKIHKSHSKSAWM